MLDVVLARGASESFPSGGAGCVERRAASGGVGLLLFPVCGSDITSGRECGRQCVLSELVIVGGKVVDKRTTERTAKNSEKQHKEQA